MHFSSRASMRTELVEEKNGSAGGGECDPCINIGEEAPH
jgi:hypothetical protein